MGWGSLMVLVPLLEEEWTSELSLSPACEDMAKRQLSAGQEEISHQNLTVLAPWRWASSLQICKKKQFLLFKPYNLCYFVRTAQDDWYNSTGPSPGVMLNSLGEFICYSYQQNETFQVSSAECLKCQETQAEQNQKAPLEGIHGIKWH